MANYCLECEKMFKSITTDKSICRHIDSKKHQKNRLKKDNKSYNTLIGLIRNNVDNNLIDNINKRVIQNYSRDENTGEYNEIEDTENRLLNQKLHKKYDTLLCGYKQIEYNDSIKHRLLINNKTYQLVRDIRQSLYSYDMSHMRIKDFDIREKYHIAMWNMRRRLENMYLLLCHIICNQVDKEYELNTKDYTEGVLEDLYGEDNNKTYENVIEELEDFIDNLPIDKVNYGITPFQ